MIIRNVLSQHIPQHRRNNNTANNETEEKQGGRESKECREIDFQHVSTALHSKTFL